MSLLPSRGPETSTRQDGEFEVVGVDEDVAPVLDALASDTAREVLNAIYENPGTPSEIAGRLDMSIQKISYHLEKLEEVDLIAVAGTRYSEKGQEMTVYEPPDDPLVLFVGTEERKSRLRSLVRRVVPTIGALGLGSLFVQRLFSGDGSWLPLGGSGTEGADPTEVGYSMSGDDAGRASGNGNGAGGNTSGTGGSDGGAGGNGNGAGGNADGASGNGADVGASEATSTPMATDGGVEQQDVATETAEAVETSAPTPAPEPTEMVQDATVPDATSAGDVATDELFRVAAETADPGIEPGVAFFLGGVFALTLIGMWWMYRTR